MKNKSDLDPNLGLMPSILDRLIDPESQGTVWRQGYGIDQMVDAVQRDLEELLNTRQSHSGLPVEYGEVLNSIVGYGLPDLTSLNALTLPQREEIGRVLEATVAKYEPRLRDIRATMLDPGDGKQRTVRFRIDARLCIDPAPEVSFETIMELTTGRHSVQQPDA